MELKKSKKRLSELCGKYRYVIVVLLIGIGLMLIPERAEASSDSQLPEMEDLPQQIDLEERLESVLSYISGAGRVEVLLTTAVGQEAVYQKDGEGAEVGRYTTVTVTDAQRNETGLIRQMISPQYRGAVVVCEGADDPTVRLAIVNAVANATGLRSDRISILKMK